METHNLNNCKKAVGPSLKTYLLLTLFIFQCCCVSAQLQLVPVSGAGGEDAGTRSSPRIQASLSLPFFDDFSTASAPNPDTKYWLPGSGVHINNTFTTSHPSVNVATFDGLNAYGAPYNFINPLFQGFTDTLTSQPINLAGKAEKDSLYLSFYWLGKGLGERPDSSDYLSLEFLDVKNSWITVWKQQGYIIDTVFKQEFIKVGSASFLHENFQFRFRAFGRSSGLYDMWHLDYVYLNEKRSARDKFIRDLALRKPLTSFLNGYYAMPLSHYWPNAARFTSSMVSTDLVNHFNNFNRTSYTFTVADDSTGQQLFTYQSPTFDVLSQQELTTAVSIKPLKEDKSLEKIRLRYKFELLTTDDKNPDVPLLNLRRNDSISAITELSDYYAFDDGTAEYGVQMPQRLGRAVVRYVLAQKDTIAGVRICLVPFNKDISGQNFTVQLYNNKDGKPHQLLTQRNVAAKYPETRNGFLEYSFSSPVAIADTFYVGWLQVNEQPVTFGYDRNTWSGKNKMFYNLGNSWEAETSLSGTVMIRPYLGTTGQEVIAGEEGLPGNENYFFPNPGRGIINWKSNLLKKIDIYTLQGILLQTILPKSDVQSASLNIPADGLYIIKASDGKQSFVQKMLIIK
jgi:hypothetical protein